MQLVEEPRQFLGLKGDAPEIPPPPGGAVETVILTGVALQDLEQLHRLSIRQGSGVYPAPDVVPHAAGGAALFVGILLYWGWLSR